MAVFNLLFAEDFIHAISLWYGQAQREWRAFYWIVKVLVSAGCHSSL